MESVIFSRNGREGASLSMEGVSYGKMLFEYSDHKS